MSNTRVFIGRLNHRARESDVEKFFKGYGRLRDISLKNGYGFVQFDDARDAEDAVYELNNREICGERVTIEHAKGTPRSGGGGGYRGGSGGFGRRDSYRDSYRDRGYDRGGYGGGRRTNYYDSRAIGKYGPPVRTKYRVIVENLSSRVSWQDLKDYLREAGDVSYADAHKHRQNEGVVDFATYDDMKRAIEKMDDTELNGRRIKLVPDRIYSKSRSRSRSRGRSRSRSHSRGRSRSRSRSARRSRSKSRSRSRSRKDSRSRSRSRSRGGSRSRSRSRKDSKSRSRSRKDSKSRSRSRKDSRSRSRSRSGSKARSRSRSQERRSRSVEEKRSRSKSKSPAQEVGDVSPKESKHEESEEKAMSRSPSPKD